MTCVFGNICTSSFFFAEVFVTNSKILVICDSITVSHIVYTPIAAKGVAKPTHAPIEPR